MRIAQVNVYFEPFMVGGAEWYVYNISRELVKMGHEVHVFTAAAYDGKTAPPRESIDGISVHRVPLVIDWSYRAKVWDGLNEALSAEEFDVIHTYDYAQPHSAVAVAAGKRLGIGTALTVFDIHSMIPRTWYKKLPMKLMDGYMAKKTLPAASRILVRAPNLVKPLIEMGGQAERIRVTPSGVRDESFGEFDGERFRERYSIQGSPLVLFMGRLNPLKGPQFLLDAAPRLANEFPGIAFAFVGPDQSGYRSVLERRAAELGVNSRVCFTGMISDFTEKMEAYAACDIFVLPTSYEGTSQAIFEAMSQGKPVVATQVGGIPFQMENGKEGFLVTHGDVESLAERIGTILRNKTLSFQLSECARAKAEGFRYSRLAADLLTNYEEVRVRNGN